MAAIYGFLSTVGAVRGCSVVGMEEGWWMDGGWMVDGWGDG